MNPDQKHRFFSALCSQSEEKQSDQRLKLCLRVLQWAAAGLFAVLAFSSSNYSAPLDISELVCRSPTQPYEARWFGVPGHRRLILTKTPISSSSAPSDILSALRRDSERIVISESSGDWKSTVEPGGWLVVMSGDQHLFGSGEGALKNSDSYSSIRMAVAKVNLDISFGVSIKLNEEKRKVQATFHLADCKNEIPKGGLPDPGAVNSFFPHFEIESGTRLGSMYSFKITDRNTRKTQIYAVTDSHVLRGQTPIAYHLGGMRYSSSDFKVIYDNPEFDIAVLSSETFTSPEGAIELDENEITDSELWAQSATGLKGPLPQLRNDGEISTVFGVPGPGTSGAALLDLSGRFAGIYQRFQYYGLESYFLNARKIAELIRTRPVSSVTWDENGRRTMKHLGHTFTEPSTRSLVDADGGVENGGDGGIGHGGDGGIGHGGDGTTLATAPRADDLVVKVKKFQVNSIELSTGKRGISTQIFVPTSPIQSNVLIDGISKPMPARADAPTWAQSVASLTAKDLSGSWLGGISTWKDHGRASIFLLRNGILREQPETDFKISVRPNKISVDLSTLPKVGPQSATQLHFLLTEKASTATLNDGRLELETFSDHGSGLSRQLFGKTPDHSVGHRFDLKRHHFQFTIRSGDDLWLIEN